jgi:hypothetical protein
MFTSLVVVDDLDFVHTIVTPDEAQPPLIVDADAASNLGALGKSSRSTYLKNTCPRKSLCSTGSSAAQSASLAALHAKPCRCAVYSRTTCKLCPRRLYCAE